MFSILNPNVSTINAQTIELKNSTLLSDLNIDQIIDAISNCWKENIRELFYSLPKDNEISEYRRSIWREMKNEAVANALSDFLCLMQKRDEIILKQNRLEDINQNPIWTIRKNTYYISAIEQLKIFLSTYNFTSPGMQGLVTLLNEYTSSFEYISFKELTLKLSTTLLSFRLKLTLEDGRYTISEGSGQSNYDDFIRESFPTHHEVFCI